MTETNLLALLLVLAVGIGAGVAFGRMAARSIAERAGAERDALYRERDALTRELAASTTEREDAVRRAHAVEVQLTRLRATSEAEAAAAAQRLADLQLVQADLAERFRLLSQEALDRTSERLVALADQRLGAAQQESASALEQRKQAVELLVRPLHDSLAKVERQLGEVERMRTDAYADLRRQVQTMSETSAGLRSETAQLVAALRAPQVRGRWGELQLRRVVEAAGMLEHCDFLEQDSVATADGPLRPDLVVQLAGGKRVVVDAKVAFSGYLEAMEAREDSIRAARLKAHARHLRDHIESLGAKRYWEHFDPTPEFVVMFVPAETFLNAALEEDPGLLEHAFDRNVVVATPSTLMALLRTVAYTWRQDALAANAQQVFALGRELHGRLATLGGHVTKLGSQLNGTVKAYNAAVASIESRVLVTARRLVELKVTDQELAAPPQVDVVARELQAPELVAAANEALVALPADVADPRYGALPSLDPERRRSAG